MTARVTIAIPTWNGARFLRETIRSLAPQADELIVLDDASSDGSATIAAREHVRVERNETRLGLGANWNRAIALCNTPYLVIAHQDDVYEPPFRRKLLQALEAHPRSFAAHCKAMTIDENGRPIDHPAGLFKERFWPGDKEVTREPDEEIALLQQGNYVIAPSVMLRMETVQQLGRFREDYQFVTDWEYWLRGLFAGQTLTGVNERLMRFRRHEQTATRESERTMRRYEEELDLLQLLAERHPSRHPYRALENNLTADFVARLRAGDRDGAKAVLRFGIERVPSFSRSPRAVALRAALRGGRMGGRFLAALQSVYLRLR